MRAFRLRWDEIRLVLRHAGILPLVGLAARKMLRPLASWRTLCFFERDLGAPEPEVSARIPLEIHLATREGLLNFREVLAQGGIPWAQAEDLLVRGSLCFLGVAEGRLVHFLWVALRPVWDPAVGMTIVLGPSEAYASSSFTDPAARGNRVQPAVAAFMIRHLASRGLQRLFYHVERHNYAGLKIAAAACAAGKTRPRRTVRFVRFAGLKRLLIIGLDSPGVPPITLPEAARARIGRFGVWLSAASNRRPSS